MAGYCYVALIVLSRPLDSVRWAAIIAQVVVPIFSQKLPACLAGLLLMMKSVG